MRAPVYHGKADEPQANSLYFKRNTQWESKRWKKNSKIDEKLVKLKIFHKLFGGFGFVVMQTTDVCKSESIAIFIILHYTKTFSKIVEFVNADK